MCSCAAICRDDGRMQDDEFTFKENLPLSMFSLKLRNVILFLCAFVFDMETMQRNDPSNKFIMYCLFEVMNMQNVMILKWVKNWSEIADKYPLYTGVLNFTTLHLIERKQNGRGVLGRGKCSAEQRNLLS